MAIVSLVVAFVDKAQNDLRPLSDTPAVSTPQKIEEPVSIDPSRVTQLFVPALDPHLVINNEVFGLDSCRPQIEPPLDGVGIGRVYECMDFALPSTSSPSLSVLAGHSSCRVDTVFNRLNEQGASLVDREVWIKTEKSGDKWLVYKVTATYQPTKDELPYMDTIWGSSEVSTAGRLVLVTCLLNADCSKSTHNFIVVAQFTGIR